MFSWVVGEDMRVFNLLKETHSDSNVLRSDVTRQKSNFILIFFPVYFLSGFLAFRCIFHTIDLFFNTRSGEDVTNKNYYIVKDSSYSALTL